MPIKGEALHPRRRHTSRGLPANSRSAGGKLFRRGVGSFFYRKPREPQKPRDEISRTTILTEMVAILIFRELYLPLRL